ncbi:MarR family winged helix-turn-helix transcriptional regulator [Pseudoxanthomonas sp. UC29_72]
MSKLSEQEMGQWIAWKRATEAVMAAVVADITAQTGLSAADFSVLTRVVETPQGRIRQQRLSDDLGWERSRLSRQLTRMEARGLLQREGSTANWQVVATADGRGAVRDARRVHAAAVRRSLINAVPSEDADAFWRVVARLGAGNPSP